MGLMFLGYVYKNVCVCHEWWGMCRVFVQGMCTSEYLGLGMCEFESVFVHWCPNSIFDILIARLRGKVSIVGCACVCDSGSLW